MKRNQLVRGYLRRLRRPDSISPHRKDSEGRWDVWPGEIFCRVPIREDDDGKYYYCTRGRRFISTSDLREHIMTCHGNLAPAGPQRLPSDLRHERERDWEQCQRRAQQSRSQNRAPLSEGKPLRQILPGPPPVVPLEASSGARLSAPEASCEIIATHNDHHQQHRFLPASSPDQKFAPEITASREQRRLPLLLPAMAQTEVYQARASQFSDTIEGVTRNVQASATQIQATYNNQLNPTHIPPIQGQDLYGHFQVYGNFEVKDLWHIHGPSTIHGHLTVSGRVNFFGDVTIDGVLAVYGVVCFYREVSVNGILVSRGTVFHNNNIGGNGSVNI